MKRYSYISMAIFTSIFLLLPACRKGQYDMKDFYKMYGSENTDVGNLIKVVASTKVYFGHQSVGNNILDGIRKWEEETRVPIKLVESTDFASVSEVPLVHFRVGSNTDPRSKIDDFVRLVDQIPAEESPIAFFKFCYVDFNEDTNVEEIFEYYKEKMLYLKDRYPDVSFVVCTVPLMGIRKGPKALAKKMLGRQPTGNIVRSEFNGKLKDEFAGIFPIFDLGGIESTSPDGSPVTYNYKGTDYPFMPEYYTYDLGHLNEFGSKTLAYNLLAFLAEQVN